MVAVQLDEVLDEFLMPNVEVADVDHISNILEVNVVVVTGILSSLISLEERTGASRVEDFGPTLEGDRRIGEIVFLELI